MGGSSRDFDVVIQCFTEVDKNLVEGLFDVPELCFEDPFPHISGYFITRFPLECVQCWRVVTANEVPWGVGFPGTSINRRVIRSG